MQRKAKAIFDRAVEIESAEERDGFVRRECAEDAGLLERVRGLLGAYAEAGSFLESPPAGLRAAATVDLAVGERPGTVVGPYKLLEQIGEGGFGVVFMAEQSHPVRRKVALKVLKPGMDTRQVVARFEAERQALAILDHPNIAKVFDGGATDSGRPFFVMELVKGIPITDYCDQNHLTPRQRLELFVRVCQAVQHAHQKGIIHRDLKPSNVLVTVHDTAPVVKVIDFGVAKALGQVLTDKTLFTGVGQMVGTPLYMSPEQAGMSDLDVDTRSDIYSLGVLLYELLTGTTPFTKERFRQAAYDEIRRIIREEEPPRPSTRLSASDDSLPTISAQRQTEPARLTKLVRGELDWIVMKALEKDRARRYETANALASDVRHYLDDEPVQACPPSVGYRFAKFSRRNKPALSVAGGIVLAVLLGVVGLIASTVRIARERGLKDRALALALASEQRTKAQEAIARENAGKAVAESKRAVDQEAIARKAEAFAKDQERMARRRFYAAQMTLAQQGWEAGDPGRVLDLLEGQRPTVGEEDLRGFEWYYLWRLCHRGRRLIGRVQGSDIQTLAFTPDGKTLATGGLMRSPLKLWDVERGREVATISQPEGATLSEQQVWAVATSSDGKTLASLTWTNEVKLWDLGTKTLRTTLGLPPGRRSRCVAFSPDGTTLAGGDSSGTATLWDVASGRQRTSFPAHAQEVLALAFSPDGKTVATAAAPWEEKKVRLWDLAAGPARLIRDLDQVGAISLAFSPDGRSLAIAPLVGVVRLYEVATGKVQASYPRPYLTASSVAFSPDGQVVAFADTDRTVTLWRPATGGRSVKPLGGMGHCVAFSPDGKTVAAGDDHGAIQAWEVDLADEEPTIQGRKSDWGVGFSPDGKTLAFIELPGIVKLWDVSAGRRRALSRGPGPGLNGLAFSPDGTLLAAGAEDATARLWDLTGSGSETTLRGHGRSVRVVAFSSEGTALMSFSGDVCHVWDLPSLRRRFSALVPAEEDQFECAALAPDGKAVATVSGHGLVRIWEVAAGRQRLRFRAGWGYTQCTRFSPDGRELAVGGQSGSLKLWDVATGMPRKAFRGHTGELQSLAFSADGKALVSCDTGGTCILWDVPTGQQRFAFRGHKAPANVAMAPDGSALAGASYDDGTVTLWRAARDEEALARKTRFDLADQETPADQVRLADWLASRGDLRQAEEFYRQARENWEQLARENPDNPVYREQRADVLAKLGGVLRRAGRLPEAEGLSPKGPAGSKGDRPPPR